MKTALGIVIYTQASEYFDELMSSITSQTNQDFDLLIINDNYAPADLPTFPDNTILVDCYERHLAPAELRIELLKEAKARGYDLLIIADADDTFSPNRVEAYVRAYEVDKSAAFYYNNLVTDKGQSVFDMLPPHVTDVRPISQANFLGMSTTAINMNQLTDEFIDSLSLGVCNIFDWYLYSRILMDVGYGKYVPGAETIYRLHDSNIAGITRDIKREYALKLEHYDRLGQLYPYFKKLHDALEKADIDKIAKEDSYQGYWWGNIIMEEHYEI